MAIEIRPNGPNTGGWAEDDLDEVVARNATVHLEQLDDNTIMLIIEDEERHVHLRITHSGKSRMRVWVYEESVRGKHE